MKTLLLFSFLFLVDCACAQLIITPSAKSTFNAVLKKSNVPTEKVNQINSFGYGFMIITVDAVDTLNKSDFVPYTDHVKVEAFEEDTDHVTGKITRRVIATTSDDITFSPVPFGGVSKLGKGIVVQPFMMEPFETHTITYRKLISVYEEYSKWDTVFRLKLSDKKSNTLKVPMQRIRFKLSSANYTIGQTLYGEVEYTTQPYYVDNSMFKSGYIKMRIRRKYVFKAPIKPEVPFR